MFVTHIVLHKCHTINLFALGGIDNLHGIWYNYV